MRSSFYANEAKFTQVRKFCTLACIFLAQGLWRDPSSASEIPSQGGIPSLRPYSTTLPSQVLRMRLPFVSLDGSDGFLADGSSEKSGFSFSQTTQVVALEYGWTDNLALALSLPYTFSSDLSLNVAQYRRSAFYRKTSKRLLESFAQALLEDGICASVDACSGLIESGYALPRDKEVILKPGDQVIFRNGVPLLTYIDSIAVNGARPENGETGFGDLQLAFKYRFLDAMVAEGDEIPIGLALTLYSRFPTGEHPNPPRSKRAQGEGVTRAGIVGAFDFLLTPATLVSISSDVSLPLGTANKRESRFSDGRRYTTHSKTAHKEESVLQTHQVGFEFALGGLLEPLEPASINGSLNIQQAPELRVKDRIIEESYVRQSLQIGTRVQLSDYGLPLVFGLQLTQPLVQTGADSPLVPRAVRSDIEVYLRL